MTTIDELADRHWQAHVADVPSLGTMVGEHAGDDRMASVTVAAEAARHSELTALRDEATALVVDDERDRVVRDSLVADLDGRIARLGGSDGATPSHTLLRCEQMDGAQSRVLRLLPNLTYPAPEHAAAAVERYRDIGRYLDEYADRFAEGVERGLSPVARNVRHCLDQLDGFVAGDAADNPLVDVGGPADWDGEESWRASLTEVVADEVVLAIRRHRDRLAVEQLPVGRDDEHAGLCHVDDTGALYRSCVFTWTGLDLDPGDVHAIGVEHITGPLAQEWAALGSSALGEADPLVLMDRMRDDEELRYRSPDEILEHARGAVARAAAAADGWFGRLPRADVVVAPVPSYLSASSAPAYYQRPAPDGSRPGRYVVNALDTDSMLRTEGEATAFHEAVPGHHFQLAIAGELEGVPTFMRHGSATAYIEGWGLYAERLAEEMGLYSSDLDRLGILTLDAFRSARLVVDTGLHSMGWSRTEAIDWMVRHTPLPHTTVATEVDRYLAIPGQALAYTIGQRHIRQLRTTAEDRLGDRFDVRAFHDTVLGHGTLALPVLTGVVERWVDAARA